MVQAHVFWPKGASARIFGRTMRIFAAAVAGLGLVFVAPIASAGPAPHAVATTPAPAVIPMGRSVGSPTEGHLIGGAHLDAAPYWRVVPAYSAGDFRWGLGSMVGMLDRSARAVRRQFPDAVMSVGHISRQGGGELDRHASHESGRDADVQFYVKNQANQPVYADHFVAFHGDGTAPSWPGAHFDDARNWALVAAWLNDPSTHVSHIFVATPIRARLLAYAARMGVAEALRDRAAVTMVQPHGSLPHDDHFHVRISCPANMQGCIENPTARAVARTHRRAPAAHAAPPMHPPANAARHALAAPAPALAPASPPPPVTDDTPHSTLEQAPPAAMSVELIDDADGN